MKHNICRVSLTNLTSVISYTWNHISKSTPEDISSEDIAACSASRGISSRLISTCTEHPEPHERREEVLCCYQWSGILTSTVWDTGNQLLSKQKLRFTELRVKLRHVAVQLFYNRRFKATVGPRRHNGSANVRTWHHWNKLWYSDSTYLKLFFW